MLKCTLKGTVVIVHFAVCSTQFAVYIMHSLQCPVFIVSCKGDSVKFDICSVLLTVYSEKCTVCSVPDKENVKIFTQAEFSTTIFI